MPSVTWAHDKHYSTFNQDKPTVQTGAQHAASQTEREAKFLVQGQVGCNSALKAVITRLTPDWNAQCGPIVVAYHQDI